jgi:hypothetical protein
MDHKNLTYSSSVNQQIIQQLKYIDKFVPEYNHIPGDDNLLADSFSHLLIRDDLDYPSEEEKSCWTNMDLELSSKYSGILNNTEFVDCFLNLPELNADPFLYHTRTAIGSIAITTLYGASYAISKSAISRNQTNLISTVWKICIPWQQLQALVR